MADLAALIEEKQRRLAELEAEAEDIRKDLLAAKQLLLGSLNVPTPVEYKTTKNSTEMAAEVLQKTGAPLHVNEIISLIEREFHTHVRYATLVGNISRLVKNRRIFERVGPNRFGLLEWAEQQEAEDRFRAESLQGKYSYEQ